MRIVTEHVFNDTPVITELVTVYLNSGEELPSDGIATGSTAIEVDTGIVYMYDESSGDWAEIGGGNNIPADDSGDDTPPDDSGDGGDDGGSGR